MASTVQADEDALSASLAAAPIDALIHTALRHRCEGILLHAILRAKLRTAASAELTRRLKPYAQRALVQSFAIREQLDELISAFSAAGVDCVLLKGGARLYANEPTATWTTLCDIDVLIRRDQAVKAFSTLESIGYAGKFPHLWDHFLRTHHHLVPLKGGANRSEVELHLKLAPPGTFSTADDWDALAPYFETVCGHAGSVLRLNAFGSALHLIIHGAGLYRLYDVVLLAMSVRNDPSFVPKLQSVLEAERRQKIPAEAVLLLACRLAAISADCALEVKRYSDWIFRREALAPYLVDRAQYLDAWFANGGRPFGPCTHLAWRDMSLGGGIGGAGRLVYQSIGRALAAAAAFGYPQGGTGKW